MKNIKLCVLIFLLVSSHALTMCQYCYEFYAPEIEKLIPFTKGELQKFKEKKINKVEIKAIKLDKRAIYNLNEEGQVTSEESFFTHKKKEFPYAKVIYKYDQNGLLTVRDAKGPYVIAYDTIAYDEKGRIIHYYSYRVYLKNRKKFEEPVIEYNMKIHYSDENKVILFDSTYYKTQFYTFNNQNEAILRYSEYGIDSVSIDTISESEYSKRYWYKQQEDSIFRLGLEYVYKNGLLHTETAWTRNWYGPRIWYKTYYTYNEQNWLMRTENENRYQDKTFYTYNESGLIFEKITINDIFTNIDKYIYQTFTNLFVN